jgi:hypothetical protein
MILGIENHKASTYHAFHIRNRNPTDNVMPEYQNNAESSDNILSRSPGMRNKKHRRSIHFPEIKTVGLRLLNACGSCI